MLAAVLYAAGNVLVAAVIGALVGSLGSVVLQPFAGEGRLLLPAVVYSIIGIFALAYALVEFGWISLPVPGLHAEVPGPVQRLAFYPRSFFLGLVVGGGFTVGCPFPTYHVILGWVAASASLLVGAFVLGAYGLGRALPVFVVGLVLFAGVRPQVITRWVRDHASVVHQVNGLGLTVLATFLLTYWGLLLTVRVLVR
ncbi:MAG: sulfite exporter TauE/SafE family protein [Chloroflexi bacterium]|nr:sulfite exporter TauE/SafE family protein [Chloroflexota bacterium]